MTVKIMFKNTKEITHGEWQGNCFIHIDSLIQVPQNREVITKYAISFHYLPLSTRKLAQKYN